MLTKRPILSLVFSLSLVTGGGAFLQSAYAQDVDSMDFSNAAANGLSDVGPAGGDLPDIVMSPGPLDDYLGGPWLEFSFFAQWGNWVRGCRPADPSALWCVIDPKAVPVIAPAWVFTAPPGGVKLTVTDAFLIGDIFEVYDFGNLIGTTSTVSAGGACGSDPDACLGVASSGAFTLSPGPHSITIKSIKNPFVAGAAYFRLDALDHMVCYKIKQLDGNFKKQDVRIENQFGWMDVRVVRPDLLCVPSTKEHK